MTDSQSSPRGPSVTRRSDRFPSVVPVDVHWPALGEGVTEPGHAVEANAHGGVLKLSRYPAEGDTVEVTNRLTGETIAARMIGLRKSPEGMTRGIAVEFTWPNDTFWGLSYRLQRTSSELMRLDVVLREGNIDLRVLRDFRDAVDYVRKTSWAVYEWHDRQLRHRDTATVLPLLTRERIRRAAKLCADVAQEMETGNLAEHMTELKDLGAAIARLHKLISEGGVAAKDARP